MRRHAYAYRLIRRLAPFALGATFFLNGCDPTLQQTVQDGIITTSTSFLSSFLQALIQVGQQSMM